MTPARAKLAECITTRDHAAARLIALSGADAAAGRAWLAVAAARAARDTAQTAVDQARADDALATTQALIDGAPTPRPTLPPARAGLVDAEDAVTAAEAARDAITAEIADLEARSASREQDVKDAAEAVLRAEMGGETVQTLMAELNDLHRRCVDKGRALFWLINQNVVRDWGENATPGISELSQRNSSPAEKWSLWRAPGIAQTALAWDAALAALKADATAPVPTLQP